MAREARDNRGLRLGVLGVVSLLLIGALGVRLWFLQVVDAPAVAKRFDLVSTKTARLAPERGRIFDAQGRILADNKRILTVVIDQEVLRNKSKSRKALFERLAGPLGYSSWTDLELRYCGPKRDDPDTLVDESDPTTPDPACNGIYDPYLPFPAKEDVTEPIVRFLRERAEDYPGVDVVEGWQRVYPYAPLASQIVGYLGAVPADDPKTAEDELQTYLDAGYLRSDRVGKAGIEQYFEKELRGTPGEVVVEIDAAGRVVQEKSRTEPVPGKDVQLNIDLKYQQYAEQALESQIKRRRIAENPYCKAGPDGLPGAKCFDNQYNFHAPAGSIVVEQHATGKIVAMASYPTFDNRWFSAGISSAKFAQLFPPDKDKNPDTNPSPLVNRAIQGRYNVGSTFKPFTAFAALNTGFVPTEYTYNDEGAYTIPPEACDLQKVKKCTFRNAWNYAINAPNYYGVLNIPESLTVSSDAFYYKIGVEMFLAYQNVGPVLQDQYRRFGFGEKSGIELPYEYKGIVPDAAAKKKLAEQKAISEREGRGFYVGDALLMAIGQGLNAVTPLQLTNAYSTIANGGYLMRPQMVKAIYEPGVPDSDILGVADVASGTPETVYTPEIRLNLEANPEHLWLITQGLIGAVNCQYVAGHAPTGCTAFRGYPHGRLPLAGKTGTAQGKNNLPENDSSVFVGFDVALDGYTIGSYLEKAGYGGAGSAPLVRCMFLAMHDEIAADPVHLSDPLNIQQSTAAAPNRLVDETCLEDGAGESTSRER